MKIIRRLILALAFIVALLAMGSCNKQRQPYIGSEGIVVYAAPLIAFTPNVSWWQKQNFSFGIDVWNQALSNGIEWHEISMNDVRHYVGTKLLGRCQPLIIVDVIESTNERVIKQDEKLDKKMLGITQTNECNVTYVWLVSDRLILRHDFVNISAHEFGHALGLDHVEHEGDSLMSEIYVSNYDRTCITKKDVEELCNEIPCTVPKVRTCHD